MPATVSCNHAAVNLNGSVDIKLTDGQVYNWPSIADLKAEIATIDSEARNAVLVMAGKWLGSEPDGENVSSNLVGKTCTFDMLDNTQIWIR